jgi:hypothetical protein
VLVGDHYNHFELPETLDNPYDLLGRAARADGVERQAELQPTGSDWQPASTTGWGSH